MPVIWNFKKWLAIERDIYRPSELQEILAEKTGIQLSHQAISALMNGKPNGIRFQTMQAICNALECNICDFFSIQPDTPNELQKKRKVVGDAPMRLYGHKEKTINEESIFPDPHQYTNKEETQQNRGRRK
jgi:putative transcriptional regulator